MSNSVPVSAISLATVGNELHVSAEVDGEWRLVIRAQGIVDGQISHIVESAGIRSAIPDAKRFPRSSAAVVLSKRKSHPKTKKEARNAR